MKKQIIAYITAVCNVYSRRIANAECAVTVSVLKDMDDVIDFIQDLDETQTDTSTTTFLNVISENEQLKRRCAELEECKEYTCNIEEKLRKQIEEITDDNIILQTVLTKIIDKNKILTHENKILKEKFKSEPIINLMTATLERESN